MTRRNISAAATKRRGSAGASMELGSAPASTHGYRPLGKVGTHGEFFREIHLAPSTAETG